MMDDAGGLTPYVHWSQLVGDKWFDVTHIATPPFDSPYAEKCKELLKQHGCQITENVDMYMLTFPAGTKKRREGWTTIAERYMIYFPDGFKLFQHFDTHRGISFIFFPQD